MNTTGERLRLLHVVPSYLPAIRYGGPIRSVHGLCKGLARRGHEVHVFTTNVDGSGVSPVPTGEAVEIEGVKVWYFETGLGRRLYRSPKMDAALAQHVKSFDLLHLHSVFLWPTAAAARVARHAGVPYIVSPRGMLVEDLIRRKSRLLKTGWIELVERANLAKATAIHATSELEAEEYRRLRLPDRPIIMAPNGVDLPPTSFTEPPRNARPRVLSLGRISWKKGLDRLITAMAHVPDAELIIAGNDEEGLQPRLTALAAELGVRERTRFVGPVEGGAKWELLCSCDIFVLPSHSENFGVAALEAMACGRPVVVSPGVGLAKAIHEAKAGAVVENEPDALAAELRRLIADASFRQLLGRNGLRHARDNFSWDGIALQMENAYMPCLAHSRSSQ